MLRILLIGKNGQLGWEFQRTLASLGDLSAVDWPEIDLAQPEAVRDLVRAVRPQIIINAAAYTAVDKAENERELAAAINAAAPAILAEEALAQNAALVHFSTDYVFDGLKAGPYVESDEPHPLNHYGQTKLARRAGNSKDRRRLLDPADQLGVQFTPRQLRDQGVRMVAPSKDYAHCAGSVWLPHLVPPAGRDHHPGPGPGPQDPAGWVRQTAGLYHLAGDGFTNRFEWAREILKLDPRPQEQQVESLVPASSAEFPTPAQRPLYVPLSCDRFTQTFNLRLPPWQQALQMLMQGM